MMRARRRRRAKRKEDKADEEVWEEADVKE